MSTVVSIKKIVRTLFFLSAKIERIKSMFQGVVRRLLGRADGGAQGENQQPGTVATSVGGAPGYFRDVLEAGLPTSTKEEIVALVHRAIASITQISGSKDILTDTCLRIVDRAFENEATIEQVHGNIRAALRLRDGTSRNELDFRKVLIEANERAPLVEGKKRNPENVSNYLEGFNLSLINLGTRGSLLVDLSTAIYSAIQAEGRQKVQDQENRLLSIATESQCLLTTSEDVAAKNGSKRPTKLERRLIRNAENGELEVYVLKSEPVVHVLRESFQGYPYPIYSEGEGYSKPIVDHVIKDARKFSMAELEAIQNKGSSWNRVDLLPPNSTRMM